MNWYEKELKGLRQTILGFTNVGSELILKSVDVRS